MSQQSQQISPRQQQEQHEHSEQSLQVQERQQASFSRAPQQQSAQNVPAQQQSHPFHAQPWLGRAHNASRAPGFWEDMESELADLSREQNNISMYDNGRNIIVEAALPGLEISDINITLEKGVLRIRGERMENETEGRRYIRRGATSYSYRLSIPEEIDEKVEPNAIYKNGLLCLTFDKTVPGASFTYSVKNSA